jgi:hypothetical protein
MRQPDPLDAVWLEPEAGSSRGEGLDGVTQGINGASAVGQPQTGVAAQEMTATAVAGTAALLAGAVEAGMATDPPPAAPPRAQA